MRQGERCLRLSTIHQSKGLEFPHVFIIGWPTASSRTNAPLTGKATWKKKGDCFTLRPPGRNVPFILFSRCSPTKKGRRCASCKVAFSRNCPSRSTNCTTLTHPIGNDRPGGTISGAKAEGTEDRSKSSGPKAKPAKQAGRSHVSRETERLTRTRPSPRAKKLPCHSREIQSPTWPRQGLPRQECPSRHNPSKTSMQPPTPNLQPWPESRLFDRPRGDCHRTNVRSLDLSKRTDGPIAPRKIDG